LRVVFGSLGNLRHEASRPSYLTHPAGVPVWVKKDICGLPQDRQQI
jgi:hypothetical protein